MPMIMEIPASALSSSDARFEDSGKAGKALYRSTNQIENRPISRLADSAALSFLDCTFNLASIGTLVSVSLEI